MADKLSVYNDINLVLGQRKLATLAESRPSRRRLDTWWDGGGVRECLEAGYWNHAIRTVSLTYSPSVSPEFGYTFAFDKPEDWVKTFIVSDDPAFANLRFDYDDKGTYILANVETIYLQYVSDDDAWGMDLSLWGSKFKDYVVQSGASKVCIATTGSIDRKAEIDKDMAKALNVARSIDAMNQPTKQVPSGSWSRSRRGGNSNDDRGNPGQLIG